MDKPVGEADPYEPAQQNGSDKDTYGPPELTSIRARALRLLLRPTAPPLALGLVVVPLLIAAETGLAYLLMRATGNIFGVVFLLGVLVVSTVWGLRLGALTTLASAAVYVYFHRLQSGGSMLAAAVSDSVAVGVFLLVALSAATLAGLARLRAREADRRRREVEVSHDELGVLAEHQAALRRVATLVARGANPSEVFAVVSDELAHCLHAVNAGLLRYEPDGSGCIVDVQYEPGITNMPVAGERIPLAGDDVGAVVLRTGRVARIDSHDKVSGPEAERIRAAGIGSIVGAPIVIDGHLWGAAIIGTTKREPLAPDAEARLCDFTDLMATAIGNAQTRADLRVLAEQQAALRRVATLVARGVAPTEVFSAVAEELAHCLGVHNAGLCRLESDGAATLVAARDEAGLTNSLVGQRFSLEGQNIVATVMRTGRVARMDNHDDAAGTAAARIRELGMRSAVGAPIIVAGRLWGAATVSTSGPEPLPADAEARVCDFADLVATAIANAHAYAELTASRVRIVAAADNARRRIERDLHDGAQQRLVSLGLDLRGVEADVPAHLVPLKERISELVATVAGVSTELQELSRGIHPAILSRGGLGPAVKLLARRSAIPVELVLSTERRLPDPVEVAAYYVVAEALTNAAKHAQASMAEVCTDIEGQNLHLSIRDDGIGGADAARGSGITGLRDRVEALGGSLWISSHAGIGTELRATIPFEAPPHPNGPIE
jgi:signal transduction histidine kinase